MPLIFAHDFAILAPLVSVLCVSFAFHVIAGMKKNGERTNYFIVLIAAVVMGTGLWPLHYLSVLLLPADMIQMYDISLVILSLFVLIIASYTSLAAVTFRLPDWFRCFVAAVVMGMGISSSHFVGIAANLEVNIVYNQTVLTLAILFALAAVYLAFKIMLGRRGKRSIYRNGWGALALIAGFCGMNGISLAKAGFYPVEMTSHISDVAVDYTSIIKFMVLCMVVMVAGAFSAYLIARHFSDRLQRLERNRLLYYDIFSNSKDAILVTRMKDGSPSVIVDANEQACALFHLPKSKLVGTEQEALIIDKVSGALIQDSNGGETVWKMMTPNQEIRYASVSARPIDINGRTHYQVSFIRDITFRKKLTMIQNVSKPLLLLTVSGLSHPLLLSLLRHLTVQFFPYMNISFEPVTIQTLNEEESPDGRSFARVIHKSDGTAYGQLVFIKSSAENREDAESFWMSKCVEFMELSVANHERDGAMEDLHDQWTGIITGEFMIDYVADPFFTGLGYGRDEIVRRNFMELLHPDDSQLFYLHVRNAIESNAPCRMDVRLRHKNESWVPMHMALGVCRQFGRMNIFFIAMIGRAEHPLSFLLDDDQKYRFLFDYHPGAVCALDLQGRFVSWNEGLERMTGYSAEQLLGAHYEKVVRKEDWTKTAFHFKQALKGISSSYETCLQRPNGELVYLYTTNLPVVEGADITGVFSISLDISERKQEELLNLQRQKELRELIETHSGILFKVVEDHDGPPSFRLTVCEGKLLERFGVNAGDVVGRNLGEILPGYISVLTGYYERVWHEKEEVQFKMRFCDTELHIRLSPIRKNGTTIEVIGIAIDAELEEEENKDYGGSKITKREREVIRLIIEGNSNKEIAQVLQISENTVKNHVSNIFAKLQISDRSQIPEDIVRMVRKGERDNDGG